jgi:hypothetical protein
MTGSFQTLITRPSAAIFLSPGDLAIKFTIFVNLKALQRCYNVVPTNRPEGQTCGHYRERIHVHPMEEQTTDKANLWVERSGGMGTATEDLGLAL